MTYRHPHQHLSEPKTKPTKGAFGNGSKYNKYLKAKLAEINKEYFVARKLHNQNIK